MFWRIGETRKALRRLEETVGYQKKRMAKIEAALNDVTKLLAEKHRLRLVDNLSIFSYDSLERLDTYTKTEYVNVE